MLEAYWSICCESESRPLRGGTVVFTAGGVVGHDLEHEFHGTYEIVEDTVHVRITVLHYRAASSEGALPHKFDLVLQGKVAPHRMVLRGRIVGKHARLVRFVCLKRSNIYQTPATAVVRANVREGYTEISAVQGNVTPDTIIEFLDIVASYWHRKRNAFVIDVPATGHHFSVSDIRRVRAHAAGLYFARSRIAYVTNGRILAPDAALLEAILKDRDIKFRTVRDHYAAFEWLRLAQPVALAVSDSRRSGGFGA